MQWGILLRSVFGFGSKKLICISNYKHIRIGFSGPRKLRVVAATEVAAVAIAVVVVVVVVAVVAVAVAAASFV